jgi:hypothetical protein
MFVLGPPYILWSVYFYTPKQPNESVYTANADSILGCAVLLL